MGRNTQTSQLDLPTAQFEKSRIEKNCGINMRTDLFKSLLAVPSCSRQEDGMVAFLRSYCAERGYSFRTDSAKNVYIRKGRLHKPYHAFPCVVAHTDTVHRMEAMTIKSDNGILRAYAQDGRQIGIGGDDKCGIFICLELLEAFPQIKVALMSGEEIGCYGAKRLQPRFFKNVGYAIEFDSPGSNTMSYSNGGVKNFADNGTFINTVLPALDRYGITEWQKHPFTDVMVLRQQFQFACLNLAAGYFRMHSTTEYIVEADVQNSILLGHEVISALGRKRYTEPVEQVFGGFDRSLRPLKGCDFPDSPLFKVAVAS